MDTVLIVDDSSFIVEGLIAFLKKKYIPLAAYGGGECLEILKRETPSVIILDIMMEPIDGWETLSRIKENPKTRNIPVLMFSAVKISPSEAVAHRISIDDCITKPVSPNKIIEAIEKVIARRDTNLMVVERWQSAGVSQDKIDEYLSLATSLEVDLSLCQNMKIQYDLGHPKDQNQEEFQAVISAIGERILHERDQIERLVREMNKILTQETGRTGSADAIRPQGVDRPENQHGISVTQNENDNPLPLSLEVTLPGTPTPDTAMALPGNLRKTDPDHPGTITTESSPPSVPVSGHPDHDAQQVNSGPDPHVSGECCGNSVNPAPGPAEPAPADVPLITAVPGNPESRFPDREPGTDDIVSEIVPQLTPLPAHPAPPADNAYPDPGERNMIPADPDKLRNNSRASSETGAGTDVPMPWNSLPERNRRRIITGLKEKNMLPTPEPVSQPPGIFARIISLVRSIFGQGK